MMNSVRSQSKTLIESLNIISNIREQNKSHPHVNNFIAGKEEDVEDIAFYINNRRHFVRISGLY